MPSPKRFRIEQKLIAGAREHLRGEEVRSVFCGQTAISPILVPLVSSLLPFARPRTVLVTDSSVLTVQQRYWSQSTLDRLVSRHERGTVTVTVTRWGLRIGEEPTIYALPSSLGLMQDIERLAVERRFA